MVKNHSFLVAPVRFAFENITLEAKKNVHELDDKTKAILKDLPGNSNESFILIMGFIRAVADLIYAADRDLLKEENRKQAGFLLETLAELAGTYEELASSCEDISRKIKEQEKSGN